MPGPSRRWLLEPNLKWLPSLSLTGQYRYTNESGLTGKSTSWSAGLVLNWPHFRRLQPHRRLQGTESPGPPGRSGPARGGVARLELEVRDALVSLSSQQASLKKALVALDAARKNAAGDRRTVPPGLEQRPAGGRCQRPSVRSRGGSGPPAQRPGPGAAQSARRPRV